MITIISPAKSLDFNKEVIKSKGTKPLFIEDGRELISILKEYSPEEIGSLMKISEKLSELNFLRYQRLNTYFHKYNNLSETEKKEYKEAIYAFNGEVYRGIDIESFNEEDLEFATNHLRILSGLYGVLRPLDLIREYRLEMGIKLSNSRGNDLYAFWQEIIGEYFNTELYNHSEKVILNLASVEYSKVINRKIFDSNIKIVDVIFKESIGDKHKIIATYAKKARGLMASYIMKNKIDTIEEIKNFSEEGYIFRQDLSTDNKLVFTRTKN